jgi:hypothetical protein
MQSVGLATGGQEARVHALTAALLPMKLLNLIYRTWCAAALCYCGKGFLHIICSRYPATSPVGQSSGFKSQVNIIIVLRMVTEASTLVDVFFRY